MKPARAWFCIVTLGLASGFSSACKTTAKEKTTDNSVNRCVTRVKIEQDLLWLGYVGRPERRVQALSLADPLNPTEVMSIEVEYQLDPLNIVQHGDSMHVFSTGDVLSYTGVQSRKLVKTGQRTWPYIMDGNRIVIKDDQFYMSGPLLNRGVIENGAMEIKEFIDKVDYTKKGSEDIVLTENYLYNLRPIGLEVVAYKDKLGVISEIDLRHGQRMIRSGNYLYISGSSRLESVTEDEVGLQIVDSSQPTALRYVKSIPIPGLERDMEEWNGRLYIGGRGVFHTVDKSDPEHPRMTHTLNLTGLAGSSPGIDGFVDSIAIHPDGIAYVALFCQGWLILDLRGEVPVIVKKIP